MGGFLYGYDEVSWGLSKTRTIFEVDQSLMTNKIYAHIRSLFYIENQFDSIKKIEEVNSIIKMNIGKTFLGIGKFSGKKFYGKIDNWGFRLQREWSER